MAIKWKTQYLCGSPMTISFFFYWIYLPLGTVILKKKFFLNDIYKNIKCVKIQY